MKRFAHYLRENLSSEAPHLLGYVDTETKGVNLDEKTKAHHLNFGWLCTERSQAHNKWDTPQWFRFDTPLDFWRTLEGLVRPKTRMYLFAHNWAFDAPVLDMFRLLPARGWKLTRAIIESPPVILRWRRGGRTILCLDTLNWFKFPLAKLGERLGLAKLPMPDESINSDVWDTYCKRDVEILRKTVRSWLAFIEENDLGGFASTLAGQSMRCFRHRFMKHRIFFDDNDQALQLSRESYHGGRVEAFRIGKVEGPIFCYDVNSMYPAVMLSNEYPIKFFTRTTHVSVQDLEDWIGRFSIVARVKIETDEPRYAHFTGEKLLFPIGRFVTTLTTPDLKCALERNEIQACDEVAVYDKANIFSSFVSELYRLRMESKERGDDVWVWLLKILMNSLYGKFGQRGKVWETVGRCDASEFTYETHIDMVTNTVRRFRHYSGIIQERMADEEGRESFPAIASHVTAYARARLWELILRAGRNNVYYCDTDSLYVNREGSNQLSEEIDENRLGALKLEKTISQGEIHGPKDYQFGEEWRCKGVRRKAVWLESNLVEQEEWPRLQGLLRRDSLNAPLILTKQKRLKRVYEKGITAPDGKVSPFTLSDW